MTDTREITAKIYTTSGSSVVPIAHIDEEDKTYILDNNLVLSLEDLYDTIAYLCSAEDKTEESELTEFANGRSCNEVIHALVVRHKNLYKDKQDEPTVNN